MADLHSRIGELLEIATELAAGNFTVPIPRDEVDDELAAIRAALDALAGDLRSGARERLAAQERAGLLKMVRASESSLRALISQLPIHVWTLDLDARVSLPDPGRPGPLVGYGSDGQLIQAALDLGADHPAVAAHLDALGGAVATCELERDGSAWQLRVTPMREAGAIVGAVCVAADVTDERAAQARRQHAQKLESLGLLAGGIAHDFNNLLVGVLANANQVLLDLPDDDRARPALLQIERAAERAAGLTRQLLAYSGKGQFVVEQISLTELVREMAQLLEVSAAGQAELRLTLSADCPAVRGDPDQLRQVVMNLITNAADASVSRGGVVEVRVGSIRASAGAFRSPGSTEGLPAGGYSFVEVVDQGVGMDQPTIERIFDPFFTTKASGHGLGLAAVLGIVKGHEGAIDVESTPGVGTRICVYLPIDTTPYRARAPLPAPRTPRARRGRERVLLADDQATVREAARMILERAGYSVALARDGAEAVEIFAADPDAFDCAVLDLTMPVLSGAEVYAALRGPRPDLPILLTSGYNEREVTELLGAGSNAEFLQKPWRASALLAKLASMLGRNEGGTE